MARGINKVILVGNLGQDPEVRYLPNGGAVATISIATSETWKDLNRRIGGLEKEKATIGLTHRRVGNESRAFSVEQSAFIECA